MAGVKVNQKANIAHDKSKAAKDGAPSANSVPALRAHVEELADAVQDLVKQVNELKAKN